MKLAEVLALVCLAGCSAPAEEIAITISRPQGRLSCEAPGRAEFTGSVLRADGKSFVLDLCLPTQECSAPIPAEISVDAPGFGGFSRYLAAGAFVHVNAGFEVQEGVCARQITVSSVASWMGARNPSGRGDELYFKAGDNARDGLLRPCVEGAGTLGVAAGEKRLTLRAGAPRAASGFTARLLRTGACDSARGWSYWIAASPVR
jgi:hypothetical protein